jgi:hypothetical protein
MFNAFADGLEQILINCQPYPGDDEFIRDGLTSLPLHFHVDTHKNDIFTIQDNKQCFDSHLHVSRVRFSSFSVGKWYAEQCTHQLRDPYQWETTHKWLMSDLGRDHCIGQTLKEKAAQLLNVGALYNEESGSDMLEDCFDVSASIVLADTFWILDRACCISVGIAWRHLENPEFNLIEWYGCELLKIDLKEFREILNNLSYQRQVADSNTGRAPGSSNQRSSENLDRALTLVD